MFSPHHPNPWVLGDLLGDDTAVIGGDQPLVKRLFFNRGVEVGKVFGIMRGGKDRQPHKESIALGVSYSHQFLDRGDGNSTDLFELGLFNPHEFLDLGGGRGGVGAVDGEFLVVIKRAIGGV